MQLTACVLELVVPGACPVAATQPGIVDSFSPPVVNTREDSAHPGCCEGEEAVRSNPCAEPGLGALAALPTLVFLAKPRDLV